METSLETEVLNYAEISDILPTKFRSDLEIRAPQLSILAPPVEFAGYCRVELGLKAHEKSKSQYIIRRLTRYVA